MKFMSVLVCYMDYVCPRMKSRWTLCCTCECSGCVSLIAVSYIYAGPMVYHDCIVVAMELLVPV